MARGEWAVILRGAEVLDFVGWNVLEEGGSKKEEKSFHGLLTMWHISQRWWEQNSEIQESTLPFPPALHTAGMAGRTRRERENPSPLELVLVPHKSGKPMLGQGLLMVHLHGSCGPHFCAWLKHFILPKLMYASLCRAMHEAGLKTERRQKNLRARGVSHLRKEGEREELRSPRPAKCKSFTILQTACSPTQPTQTL